MKCSWLACICVYDAQLLLYFNLYLIFYTQACRNPEITLVEYAQPELTIPSPKTSPSSNPLPTEAKNTDICQRIDSLQDKINNYTVLLKRPRTVEDRRIRCSKLIKKLGIQANKSNDTFYFATYPKQSCQTNESEIKLMAKLNLEAVKYVSLYM